MSLKDQVQKAVDLGYSPMDIKVEFERVGKDPAEAMRAYYGPKAKEALGKGYSSREVLKYMQSTGVIPEAPYADADATIAEFTHVEEKASQPSDSTSLGQEDVKQAIADATPLAGSPEAISSLVEIPPEASISVDMTPEEQYSSLVNMHTKYSTEGKALLGFVGSSRMKQEAELDVQAMNGIIVNELKQRGVDAELRDDGTLIYYNEQGEVSKLDQGFLDSLLESKREISGAIVGGAAGARGFALGPAVGLVTTAAGTALGAAFGRGSDVLANAFSMKEELEYQFVVDKMVDAGVADATMGIAFGSMLYSAKSTYYGTIAVTKVIGQAFDAFALGNRGGAYDALKSISNLTEVQIDDMLAEWSRVSGTAIGSTKQKRADQAAYVFATTTADGAKLVDAALPASKTAGSKLAAQISDRADQLTAAISNLASDNVGTVLTDDLKRYTSAVGAEFERVKQIGVESMKNADYRFNYDKLAVEPILAQAEKAITNPAMLESFYLYADKIRQLGQATALETAKGAADKGVRLKIEDANPLRAFENLIELRRTINEFRYNKKFRSVIDREASDKVASLITAEITSAARKHMPNGAGWLKQWRSANREYAKMKGLEHNVMYRALTLPGVGQKQIVDKLSAKITSIDGTFMEVMGALPIKTRVKVEASVLGNLTAKHTVGFEGGKEAINFPLLAKELAHVTFTTKESRALKRTISELAEVYKNDVHLSVSTGRIPMAKATNYLAADVATRGKIEMMNMMFSRLKQHMPTEKARQRALVTNLGKLLDNPTNVRTTSDILNALPEDPEMQDVIRRMAIQYAKTGERQKYPKVPLYRVAKPGTQFKSGETALGRGRAMHKDKAAAKAAAKAGSRIYEEDVLPGRIAASAELELLLGRKAKPADLKNKRLVIQLKNQGFLGVSLGDKVTVFK